jgi:hypothetical protein
MAIYQQTLPASVRFGPQNPQENYGSLTSDRRPYLVPIPTRRSVVSTKQTVSATRQFFALFPHESEDARITGSTRSLYRRLLALNLPRATARKDISSELREGTDQRFKLVDTHIA